MPRSTRLATRKTSRRVVAVAVGVAAALGLAPTLGTAAVIEPRLLTAANETVMAHSAITNTGPTVIQGNIAMSPNGASSVTGFPPGQFTGASNFADAVALNAQNDLVTAYNDAAGATPFKDMSGVNLGGLTLTPGVYHFSSSAQLTGTLTLDGQGNTNALFIFQIGSTLTTASAARVVLQNGAGACAVYWQLQSSATFGTTTSFQGTVMALVSITMTTGATIGVGGGVNGGRALAMNGAVTLDSNVIIPPPPSCPGAKTISAPASSGKTSRNARGGPTRGPTHPDTPGVPSVGGASPDELARDPAA